MSNEYPSLLSENSRGVSNVVSVVLLAGVVIVGIGVLGAAGFAAVSENVNSVSEEQINSQFERISGTVALVSDTPLESRQTGINFGPRSGAASVKPTDGTIAVSVVSAPELTGYENPDSDNCNLVYGDNTLSQRPIYDCSTSVSSPSNISFTAGTTATSIDPADPAGPDSGAPQRVTGTVSAVTTSSNGFGSQDATVEVYNDAGNLVGQTTVSPSAGTFNINTRRDGSEFFRVEIKVSDAPHNTPTRQDSNGVAIYIDGETSAPEKSVYLVPGSKVLEGAELTTQETPYSADYGVIEYNSGNQNPTTGYQGGGVWKKQDTGSVEIISEPEFGVRRSGDAGRADTAVLPITLIRSDGDQAISQYIAVQRTARTDLYPERFLTEDQTLKLEITSKYAAGWERYFRSRFGGISHVDVAGSDNTVTVFFGTGAELYVQSQTTTIEASG